MTVQVLGSPASAEVARVLTCLFEKDVEFQLIRVDSFRGPKRLPRHLKLQRHEEAVTFRDGNVTLAEPRKILWHIAEKYKNQGYTSLSGSDELQRHLINCCLAGAQRFDDSSADMLYSLAYLPPEMPLDGGRGSLPSAGTNQSHRQRMEEMLQLFEKSRKDLGQQLDYYNERLGKVPGEKRYLMGNHKFFTLADLYHLPNADRLAADPRSARLIESRENVREWLDNICSRDSWKMVKEPQRNPVSAEAPPF